MKTRWWPTAQGDEPLNPTGFVRPWKKTFGSRAAVEDQIIGDSDSQDTGRRRTAHFFHAYFLRALIRPTWSAGVIYGNVSAIRFVTCST